MADSVYPPWLLEHATDTASLGSVGSGRGTLKQRQWEYKDNKTSI